MLPKKPTLQPCDDAADETNAVDAAILLTTLTMLPSSCRCFHPDADAADADAADAAFLMLMLTLLTPPMLPSN